MKVFSFKTRERKLLADIATPVSIYLRLRDVFPNSIMLESSDHHGTENSMSYIACQPIAGIVVENGMLSKYYPNQEHSKQKLSEVNLVQEVETFRKQFEAENEHAYKYISNGMFGYFRYEAVEHFEQIKINQIGNENNEIPLLQYHVYKYIIAINHAKNELHLFENYFESEQKKGMDFEQLVYLIQNKEFPGYRFKTEGNEQSPMTDEDFKNLVIDLKKNIKRGDVFQIVGSRAFSQKFSGDEFNVYRALRSINPSPYLFYFDYGNFRLFGSSPEAQIVVKNQHATIYPIAGTIRRTGNDVEDAKRAEQLSNDAKENSEHVMLVDLARNDLSRHCDQVKVESYKELQFYSHVIHMVSKVTGRLNDHVGTFEIVADTFPAGTLSGAPKHRAMQLLDEKEKSKRGFYSGAIGFFGFNGDFNHAIMIRSFMSKNNTLHYQVGSGFVIDSTPEHELKEINNKIAALRSALILAQEI